MEISEALLTVVGVFFALAIAGLVASIVQKVRAWRLRRAITSSSRRRP
ncbi:MAG: hypothetical protein GY898_23025 [Proteobacteria bacterium]|nr:hypothetical protein [Pseudomonadota bacterium]